MYGRRGDCEGDGCRLVEKSRKTTSEVVFAEIETKTTSEVVFQDFSTNRHPSPYFVTVNEVLKSMSARMELDTEQYFSCESARARSTASSGMSPVTSNRRCMAV